MDRVSDIMRRAVVEKVFPGAVLWVNFQGTMVFFESFGRASLRPESVPATHDTVYDLASLTKPIVTATCAALLSGQGRLSLDDPVHRFIPAFSGEGRESVTVMRLLNHSSGLPAWRPLFERIDPSGIGTPTGKHLVIDLICKESLTYPIGTKSVYSDLGFIILGHILESAAGAPLEDIARRFIFEPLGMKDTFFLPLGSADRSRLMATHLVASTEDCPWRGKILHGVVHDENAYAMGGVSGHAGLFGTAIDVGIFASTLLDVLDGKNGFLSQDLLALFTTRYSGTPESSWGLGWDTPSHPSSSGRTMSPGAFGHLGYTGTSLWIDPPNRLIVVLLSNRVHPTSKNDKIKEFRPVLHDRIAETLGLC